MGMDDGGTMATDSLTETDQKAGIDITDRGQLDDRGNPCAFVTDLTAGSTDKGIFDAGRMQTAQQIKDLQGAAVKMSTCLNVKNFHGVSRSSSKSIVAAATILSTVKARMQSN
jgi:hypothetical protein